MNGENAEQGSTDQPPSQSWQAPSEPQAPSPFPQPQTTPPDAPASLSQPLPPPGWPQYPQGLIYPPPPPGYYPPPSQPLPPMGAWPPQPGMPAPPTYPGVSSYPAPPGYAGPPSGYLYQAPGAPWQPQMAPWSQPLPTAKSTSRTLFIISFLITGLVLALVIGGVDLLLHQQPTATPSVFAPTSTATTAPTPTPGQSFSATVPGPGCGTSGWVAPSGQSSSSVQCGKSSLLLKQLSTAQYISEVDWTAPYIDAPFTAQVTLAALTDKACGGLGFINAGTIYAAYVCDNGVWYLYKYSSDGTPLQQAVGVTPIGKSYVISMTVTATNLALSINNANVTSQSLTDAYEVDAISLLLYNGGPTAQDSSGTFSAFRYTPA